MWGLAGILHDLDYEMTEKSPEEHSKETVKILEPYGLDPNIIQAILAHAGMAPCQTPMEWVIYAVDPLTGLIIAATLMHPDRKLHSIDLAFVQRRYKEKSFARGARREDIEQVSHVPVISLDEFITICIRAMQEINSDLGL